MQKVHMYLCLQQILHRNPLRGGGGRAGEREGGSGAAPPAGSGPIPCGPLKK